MDADVLILDHDPSGERQAIGHKKRLIRIIRIDGRAQGRLFGYGLERQALHRADIDTGIALGTFGRVEHGLHITVETALHLCGDLLGRIAQLNFLEKRLVSSTWSILRRSLSSKALE